MNKKQEIQEERHNKIMSDLYEHYLSLNRVPQVDITGYKKGPGPEAQRESGKHTRKIIVDRNTYDI